MYIIDSDEVIKLRVEKNMTPQEIWRELGFFSTVRTISKIIAKAEQDGTITEEQKEKTEKVILQREKQKEEAKRRKAEEVRLAILEQTKNGVTRIRIEENLKKRFNKPISHSIIKKIEEDAVKSGEITEDEMLKITSKREATNKEVAKERGRRQRERNLKNKIEGR